MPNEREVRSGFKKAETSEDAHRGDGARDAVPGIVRDSSDCWGSARRDARRWRNPLDKVPAALVHRLKTLRVHLQVAKEDCDYCVDFDEYHRTFPQPEVREIRRKLETAEAILKEILE